MRKLIEIVKRADNTLINEVLEIFTPLLNLLALDNELFHFKQTEFEEIIESKKQFLHHPFHLWFKNLLKSVIILDSQAVYDMIRNLFLDRFALRSPNCLMCSDEYGCCHSTYSLEQIDYERIITKNLVDSSFISRFRNKNKLRVLKDGKNRKYCAAFEISSKKCMIHPFKPPTCCKYPLISNIHNWSEELEAWTGTCAHAEELWITRVHPAIMNNCRDLWIYAQLLWDSEQKFFYRLKDPVESEILEIIRHILAMKQCKWLRNPFIIKKLLHENYSVLNIQLAFKKFEKNR